MHGSPLEMIDGPYPVSCQSRWKKKHAHPGDIKVIQTSDVPDSSLHGGQVYGSFRKNRSQSEKDNMLQVPASSTSNHKWLEDAITEWQVGRTRGKPCKHAMHANRPRSYSRDPLNLSRLFLLLPPGSGLPPGAPGP